MRDTPRMRELLQLRIHHKGEMSKIDKELRTFGVDLTKPKMKFNSNILTKKQLKLHNFMTAYIKKNGEPPLFKEMMEHMGVGYSTSITSMLQLMTKKGAIIQSKGQFRNNHPVELA
jgi:hypothetical protein